MMTSLFSIFDPHSWGVSWALSLCWLGLVGPTIFTLASKGSIIYNLFTAGFKQHLNSTLRATTLLQHSLFLAPLFMSVLYWNGLGLLPYVFTTTSHLSVTLSVALSVWLCFILFGWVNQPMTSMSCLVPTGTPALLMPFMVIIETVSIVIRPITLSVRLCANMIAGHLLLSLCSGGFTSIPLSVVTLGAQTLLFTLEVAVAAIQAYVFITLIALYSKES